jgi:hypothetical protein
MLTQKEKYCGFQKNSGDDKHKPKKWSINKKHKP